MHGNGLVQTSSPLAPSADLPCSSNTSTARPRPRAWISPRHTGPIGLPSTKQEMISVPPEIDARWMVAFTWLQTQSKLSATSGEPVEVMARTLVSLWVLIGAMPALAQASMYLADV